MSRKPGPLPGLGGEPVRPILHVHPDMAGSAGDVGKMLSNAVRYELYEAAKRFTKNTKISGVSFVLAGIRFWWEELVEINPVSAGDYFRALADLAEARTHEQKMNAEGRRRDAVERLITGVKHMPPEGGAVT